MRELQLREREEVEFFGREWMDALTSNGQRSNDSFLSDGAGTAASSWWKEKKGFCRLAVFPCWLLT